MGPHITNALQAIINLLCSTVCCIAILSQSPQHTIYYVRQDHPNCLEYGYSDGI